MNLAQIYFFVCGAAALFGAIAGVASKNPIRGALGLMVMIIAIACLFLALHAEFLAAIQLIVYAGAVVVLFLFVIMLLGPDAVGGRDARGLVPRILGGTLFGIAGIGAIVLVARAAKGGHAAGAVSPDFGSVEAFSRELFTTGLVPFELSSALLMVAVLGSVAVARGKQGLSSDTEATLDAARGRHGGHASAPITPITPITPRTRPALEDRA